MTLLGDLDAFYQEHRRCGELESEVTDDEPGGSSCDAPAYRSLIPGEFGILFEAQGLLASGRLSLVESGPETFPASVRGDYRTLWFTSSAPREDRKEIEKYLYGYTGKEKTIVDTNIHDGARCSTSPAARSSRATESVSGAPPGDVPLNRLERVLQPAVDRHPQGPQGGRRVQMIFRHGQHPGALVGVGARHGEGGTGLDSSGPVGIDLVGTAGVRCPEVRYK